MKIIAVSGVARAGKDTIANGLADVLKDMNPSLNVLRTSFADDLKSEMRDFILEKFNIDVLLADGKDKELIRPLLVAHGQARRQQTKGRYWIDILEKKIQTQNPDITIISDLRFAEEEADELFWLKNSNGKLIHVSRFHLVENKKQFVKPINSDEKRNDPLLKKNSDFSVCWKDSENESELKSMTKHICEDFYYKNISYFVS
jgi:hypothetical protein